MQRQRKMITVFVVVVTVATLLVTVTITTQAFAAINLNSSKSNIYRSTQSVGSNEGGSVEQTSTNTCECPSNDIIQVIDFNDD